MIRRHISTDHGLTEFLVWMACTAGALLASILLVDHTSLRVTADFLPDAIAFEAVVVSVAIPVGLEVVGRLYDKYNSNQVKAFFVYRMRLVPLILTVFSSVVLMLSLRAGLSESYPTLSLFAFVGALATAALFLLFLSRIIDFVVNEPFAVTEQMDDVVEQEFTR